MKKDTTVLIPTYKRVSALAVTLTGLCYQIDKCFDVVISDQTPDYNIQDDGLIRTIVRILELNGHEVRIVKNLPPKGMAQQRQFLLDHSGTSYSLFLDDDLILEPYVIRNMKQSLQNYQCGFVGSAVIGLSYQNDHRPHQQQIEFWDGTVLPETIIPCSEEWKRYVLHNAANIYHVQQKYQAEPDHPLLYKVAWVGGCVMYDTEKLRAAGGFDFWKELPDKHCGEDVLAQLRVMKRFGGCGILPSGVYHQELETTVPDREINAPEYLEI